MVRQSLSEGVPLGQFSLQEPVRNRVSWPGIYVNKPGPSGNNL